MNDTRCASDTARCILYTGTPRCRARREIRLIFTFNRLHRTRRAPSENYQSIPAVIYIADFTRVARDIARIKWPPVYRFIYERTQRVSQPASHISRKCVSMFLLLIEISRAIRSSLAKVTLEDASRSIVTAINQPLFHSLSLCPLVCIQAVSNEREHVAEIAK